MEDPGLASMDRIMAIASGVINDVDEHGTGTWQSVREYLIHCELRKPHNHKEFHPDSECY